MRLLEHNSGFPHMQGQQGQPDLAPGERKALQQTGKVCQISSLGKAGSGEEKQAYENETGDNRIDRPSRFQLYGKATGQYKAGSG